MLDVLIRVLFTGDVFMKRAFFVLVLLVRYSFLVVGIVMRRGVRVVFASSTTSVLNTCRPNVSLTTGSCFIAVVSRSCLVTSIPPPVSVSVS